MADRILTWYIDTLTGDSLSAGPVFVLDRAYHPRVVRIYAKRVPDAGHLSFDIKDDGESIFPNDTPFLPKGLNLEEVAEDFVSGEDVTLERYSVITLDLTSPNGAAGITVHLELDAAEDEDQEFVDT
jgi:hypothetical protein